MSTKDGGAEGVFDWDPSSVVDSVCVSVCSSFGSYFDENEGRGTKSLLLAISSSPLRYVIVAAVAVVVLTGVPLEARGVFLSPIVIGLTLISVVPAFFVALYVWDSKPTNEGFSFALLATYLLGILFAGLAYVFNSAVEGYFVAVPVVGTALFFYLFVGPVEEAVKLLAAHLTRYRLFRGALDGAAYGAFAALGFVTAENALYIIGNGVLSEGTLAETLISRAGVGPAHVLWSAVAGYYLGLAKTSADYTAAVALKGLLIAAVLHATYNTFVTYEPAVVGSLGSYVPAQSVSVVVSGVFLFGFYAGVWYFLEKKIRRYRAAHGA